MPNRASSTDPAAPLRVPARVPLFLTLVFLTVTLTAQGASIYVTGFETSEGYSAGHLSGENGWSGSTVPLLSNSAVFAGSEAISVSSNGTASGAYITTHSVVYNSATDPDQTVDFDIEFMSGTTGTTAGWEVLTVNGDAGFVGQLYVTTAGIAKLGGATGVALGTTTVTTGTWNDFQLILDFQTQMMSGYVNSTLLGTTAFAATTTSLSNVGLGIAHSTGTSTQSAYFDSLSIASVPEPAAGGLMAFGVAALIALRSRVRVGLRGAGRGPKPSAASQAIL